MVLDKKKAYKNLKKKGFVDSENKSGDHKYLEFYYKDKLILYTKLSHGSSKDLNSFLIKQMSNQCKINKSQFADLVNCHLDESSYLAILKEEGYLD